MAAALGRSITGLQFTMTGTDYIANSILVATGGTQVPLSQVTTPHWSFWYNLDQTNYVQLYNGVAGAVLARLNAGEVAFFPLDPGAVPYAKANTAAVQMEYLILAA